MVFNAGTSVIRCQNITVQGWDYQQCASAVTCFSLDQLFRTSVQRLLPLLLPSVFIATAWFYDVGLCFKVWHIVHFRCCHSFMAVDGVPFKALMLGSA